MDFSFITSEIIRQMKDCGYWDRKSMENGYTGEPTAWDINCGFCENWAVLAADKFGGHIEWHTIPDEDAYLEGLFFDISHCVLVLNNKYYDSQSYDGVDNVSELDIFRLVDRESFIKRI